MPILCLSLVTRASLTAMALLAMARRTSPFEDASPALATAASTLKPTSRSARGTVTLGRSSAVAPSSAEVAQPRVTYVCPGPLAENQAYLDATGNEPSGARSITLAVRTGAPSNDAILNKY